VKLGGWACLLMCGIIACRASGADQPATVAKPAGVDEKLWNQMVEIDARGAAINDLAADFTQEKHTPLLKKPLVSTGQILIKGSASLWTTTQPEPTVMRIDDKEIRLLYPRQKVMEVYRTDERMGSLAASPFPRLAVLTKHFTFEQVPVRQLVPNADEGKFLAIRMKPTQEELRKHIDEVTVVLEIATGFVQRAQTIDTDGDRIVLTFSNLRINTGLKDKDLEMQVPAGVSITRPLEGGGGGGADETGQGKRK
jgi:outer membrane lipoprotein-sorting protein